jgi:hypothetical protein
MTLRCAAGKARAAIPLTPPVSVAVYSTIHRIRKESKISGVLGRGFPCCRLPCPFLGLTAAVPEPATLALLAAGALLALGRGAGRRG